MASIYEIQDKYQMIQSLIEQGIEPEAFDAALNAIDGELSEKLENYAMVIKNIESDIAGLKAEEGRLNERRKGMEGNVKRMKLAMENALLTSGQKSLKGEKFSFNVQKNKAGLNILDENLIPQEYISEIKEVKVFKNDEILTKLKEGQAIEGVEIKQGQSIRIR